MSPEWMRVAQVLRRGSGGAPVERIWIVRAGLSSEGLGFAWAKVSRCAATEECAAEGLGVLGGSSEV